MRASLTYMLFIADATSPLGLKSFCLTKFGLDLGEITVDPEQ